MEQVLIAGIDTLEVGFCLESYRLKPDGWELLEAAKKIAQAGGNEGRKGSVELLGESFEVYPSGTGRHDFILSNGDVTLRIKRECSGGDPYPEVHCVFRSAFLWRDGWELAYQRIRSWLNRWAVIVRDKVSRVDLCADIAGPLPEFSRDYREVVTRALSKGDYATGDFSVEHYSLGVRESGFRFGAGAILCRIYDKTLEIERKSLKRWFHDLWRSEGWEPGTPVTRVEFQLRRNPLRALQCDSVDDLKAQIGDLWKYVSEKWLTIRDSECGDRNRSRWELKPFWRVVQGAVSKFGEVVGVSRLKQIKPTVEALERQVRGGLVSIGALVDAAVGAVAFDGLAGKQALIWKVAKWFKDDRFESDMAQRRFKFAGVL